MLWSLETDEESPAGVLFVVGESCINFPVFAIYQFARIVSLRE